MPRAVAIPTVPMVVTPDASLTSVPRATLHQQALAAELVECVRRSLASSVDDLAVVAVVRRCAREARRDGLRPEALVVMLRTVWYEAVGGRWSRSEPDRRLLELTNLTLDAYFEDPANA